MDIQAIRKALKDEHTTTSWNHWTGKKHTYNDSGFDLLETKMKNQAGDIIPNFSVDGYDFYFQEQFGGEGQGDDYWIVFYVLHGDEKKYYKIPGWYASHNGREIDPGDTYEVEPKEVTVIQWHKKVG